MSAVRPLRWNGRALVALDQRLLPSREVRLALRTPADVARAIRSMVLRGAPLIGCAAAYGLALAARRLKTDDPRRLLAELSKAARILKGSRPTAVALAERVDRLMERARREAAHPGLTGRQPRRAGRPGGSRKPGLARRVARALESEARAVDRSDAQAGRRMAELGAALLPRRSTVITYCNTGALATSGPGTALGVILKAFERGKIAKVYACETRPYLQGSRLTAWELGRSRVPYMILTDNMAGHILATEKVDAVLVGADRIAMNGDTANKIGTYGLAVLARHHRVPFYVVAPTPTIDPRAASGRDIPIEERSAEEVLAVGGRSVAPKGARARHPAFDVTPAGLVTALVTERGVLRPPRGPGLKALAPSPTHREKP